MTLHRTVWPGLRIVLRIVFHTEFLHLPRDPERSADNNCIPCCIANLLDVMTNPAEAMPRRSSWWNSMTVRRICFPSLVRCAFGPLAHSRVWPCDRALRRAYQTGPQECLRVVGQSRSDEDRVPSSPELRSFVLGMCTNAPSRLPIPALLDLSKRVLALPRLRQESRMYLFPPFFWAYRYPLPSSMRLYERITPDSGFHLPFFPKILHLTEFAPWGTRFCLTPCDWPFLSRFLVWLIVVFENMTAWFDPNFPTSRRLHFFWGPSWDTQPTWMFSFKQATDPFSATFLWLFTALPTNLSVSEMTTVTFLASGLRLVIQANGRVP